MRGMIRSLWKEHSLRLSLGRLFLPWNRFVWNGLKSLLGVLCVPFCLSILAGYFIVGMCDSNWTSTSLMAAFAHLSISLFGGAVIAAFTYSLSRFSLVLCLNRWIRLSSWGLASSAYFVYVLIGYFGHKANLLTDEFLMLPGRILSGILPTILMYEAWVNIDSATHYLLAFLCILPVLALICLIPHSVRSFNQSFRLKDTIEEFGDSSLQSEEVNDDYEDVNLDLTSTDHIELLHTIGIPFAIALFFAAPFEWFTEVEHLRLQLALMWLLWFCMLPVFSVMWSQNGYASSGRSWSKLAAFVNLMFLLFCLGLVVTAFVALWHNYLADLAIVALTYLLSFGLDRSFAYFKRAGFFEIIIPTQEGS